MKHFFIAHRWNKPLVLGASDVEVAFDSVDHASMQIALLDQGLHPDLARAVIREVSGIQCTIELDGAGRSEQFPLERGGNRAAS